MKKNLTRNLFFASIMVGLAGSCWAMKISTDPRYAPPTYHNPSQPWHQFVADFSTAFFNGDVDKLEKLKESNRENGFYNINDLGGPFAKYGAGMDKWGDLMSDARKNKPRP